MRWIPLFFRRQISDRQLDAELRFHLEQQISEHVASGVPPEEARRKTHLDFGGLEQIKEDCRDVRPGRWIHDFGRDVLYGASMLRRSPGFTTLAVLTLGVALGISAIMFSIINCVLLRPLPYKDSGRLVRLFARGGRLDHNDLTPAEFVDWARQNHALEAVAAAQSRSSAVLGGPEYPEQVQVMEVSAGFFDLLGVPAYQGRVFRDEDQDFRDGKVAVLSYGLWQRLFGGDAGLIGRSITLDGKPIFVAGIASSGFHFLEYQGDSGADIWIPRAFRRDQAASREVVVIARLRKDTPLRQAQAEMDGITGRREASMPRGSAAGIQLVSLHETVAGDARRYLLVLFGAVTLVLMTAGANIANILLARAGGRRTEMAVRTSLGASRGRLVRQMLTESVLLCLLGGLVGIVLAALCERAIIAAAPPILPRVQEIALDVRAFGFALLVAILTGLFCGFIPAMLASKRGMTEAFKDGHLPPLARSRGWLGKGLVSAQIALALILLVAAGLMIQGYMRLLGAPFGFDATNVLMLDQHEPSFKVRYRSWADEQESQTRFKESVLEQIQKVPGVECAAIGPLHGSTYHKFMGERQANCALSESTPDYFRVMRIRPLSGRMLQASDTAAAPRVAVVNQSAAEKLWPGSNPIGKELMWLGGSKDGIGKEIQVVGLVGNIRIFNFEEGPPQPMIYVPISQNLASWDSRILVRATGDPLGLVPRLRKAIQWIDKDAPLGKIEIMEQYLDSFYTVSRFNLLLISIFGGLAFGLATIGIYGIIAYSVSQRTHEIGIRMALGAQRGDVLRLFIKQGLWMVLVGEFVGLAGAVMIIKLIEHLVYGITAAEPGTYIVVSITWAIVAILASYLPARRATLIDPLLALKCE
jgi:putative ABC transport system permease protein